MTRLAPLLLAGAIVGCNTNKAPAALNPIEVWFWDNYVPGSDADIAAAITTYDKIGDVQSATGTATSSSYTGALTQLLAPSDLATVNLTGNNPATAPGLIAIDDLPCTLDQLEPLLYRADQNVIHPGDYASYMRMYTSSLDDYTSRVSETITWTVTYASTGVGYTATVNGGLRRIPAQGSATPFGPIILARTWLPAPANVMAAGQSFRQDYGIEVYYERTPGHVRHSYTDWRDIDIDYGGVGPFTASNSLYQSVILSNDVQFDAVTAKQCGQ